MKGLMPFRAGCGFSQTARSDPRSRLELRLPVRNEESSWPALSYGAQMLGAATVSRSHSCDGDRRPGTGPAAHRASGQCRSVGAQSSRNSPPALPLFALVGADSDRSRLVTLSMAHRMVGGSRRVVVQHQDPTLSYVHRRRIIGRHSEQIEWLATSSSPAPPAKIRCCRTISADDSKR